MLRKADAQTYTTHPLIRAHYFGVLSGRSDATQTHEGAKDYYLSLAPEDMPEFPTMDDLLPLIEVVYHACHAGAYDEAEQIRWERISQRERQVVAHQLGAYETELALIREFFPDRDLSRTPAVSTQDKQGFIISYIGYCLMSLGRLREAINFFERDADGCKEVEDWSNASRVYNNLTTIQTSLGKLGAAADAAQDALAMAEKADKKADKRDSTKWLAWIAHLRGEMEMAGEAFKRAEVLEKEFDPRFNYLYSLRGIQHASHLRRVGDADYARRITNANLEICQLYRWADSLSRCHQVLGNLDGDAGDHNSARQHYDEALRLARGIQRRDVLIEGLLGRGRWAAKLIKDLPTAKNDLNEALSLCLTSGYRIHEADCRVGLAWLQYHSGDPEKARQEAERAKTMSAEMGYHWGGVDADEILALL
jgi:tetratricopeptide (TPR) repeat protein